MHFAIKQAHKNKIGGEIMRKRKKGQERTRNKRKDEKGQQERERTRKDQKE